MRLKAGLLGDVRLQSTMARYCFAVGSVVVAFLLRSALMPLTGRAAPFVLLYPALLATSLYAGVGPAMLSIVLGFTIALAMVIARHHYEPAQLAFQSLLYLGNGLVIVYLARLIDGRRQRMRQTIDLSPDAYLLAGRDAGLSDVNDAACRLLGYEREELLEHEQIARRAAEEANAQLRESEERFRLTIDDAPIGMALIALDGRFVRVNHVLCEMTGFSVEELLTLSAESILHPDDREDDVTLGHQLIRGEIPRFQRETRYICKDGSTIDVMASASVLRGADGVPRYFIAQMEDITLRKRAAEALRFSEAKFSGIVSIATDAIISADDEQRITLFNDGAQAIFGYTGEEAMGMALEQLIPERSRASHREHFARFMDGDEAARTMAARQEIFGLRKNGEEFPAEASISKVTVGTTRFFSVVLRDITYRKSVEAALQRAVAARDEVLGVVAHDLRNPLSTIIASVSLLERPEPEPERRDPTPRLIITRSAQRMNALIQDLLDVAMVEAGRMKIDQVRLDVGDLVREVAEAQMPLAAAAQIDLRVQAARDPLEILGDRNRLMRVLDNLIGNAFKFTRAGGRVEVTLAAWEREVVCSVADTGPGIDPEGVTHVFDRFWQAAGRAKRLGAGLGLPIARGIVEAHGGRMWVESTVGVGSTFYFAIPTAVSASTSPLMPQLSRTRVDRGARRSA
jgi:PAS domain S-box-containing protein